MLATAAALAGCNADQQLSTRALQPLPSAVIAELERKHMPKESPILVRLFKEEAEFEVWKQDDRGRFALLKTFPICRWSGDLGPKIRQGDRQAPEGFYTITPAQLNPNSLYYLAFDLGYPNAFDRAHGRTGGALMVHGDCLSAGCYAMTDDQIGEIYALAREAFLGGQRSFQVQAYPFRMTPAKMARHRDNPNMPFWKMLKEGNDHFEVTRREPKVDVCEKRYVFDAHVPANANPVRERNFDPAEACPAYQVPRGILAAVAEKQGKDAAETAELVRRGAPSAPIGTGQDGGTHPVFVAKLKPGSSEAVPASGSLGFTGAESKPASKSDSFFARLFGRGEDEKNQQQPIPGPVPEVMPARKTATKPKHEPVHALALQPRIPRQEQKVVIANPAGRLMSGAQPVVSAGSFDKGGSAFP